MVISRVPLVAAMAFAALAIVIPLITSAQDTGPTSQIYCPNLTQNQQYGSCNENITSPACIRHVTGTQVSQLQRFLVEYYDLNPDDYISGFFGRKTRDNVRKFQCEKMNICSGSEASNGYGAVGPRTRAKITSICSTGLKPVPMSLPNFYFSPGSGGPAPLTVTFEAEGLATTWTDPQTGLTRVISDRGERHIDFGDGSARQKIVCPNTPTDTCMVNVTHVYQNSGTYIATLLESGMAGVVNIAKLTITVTGNTTATSGLYGKITKTIGNCMPSVFDPNNPGMQGPNSCNTSPLSTDVYAYPPYNSKDYIEPLTWSGTGTYEYFGVSAVLEDHLYGAPLTVNFSTSNHQGGAIVFGDGEQIACAATGSYPGPCNNGIKHVYRQAGTYVAKLLGPAGETLQQARIRVLESGLSPIARTTSDSAGNYSMQLSPGKYSVLVKDNGSIGCASVSVEGFCVAEIKSGGMTLHNMNINAAVW